jgi:PAS domain S-box-containing protein
MATILLVEDNPITRKMVWFALHSAGYDVREAPDGRTALNLVEPPPDLVLQDLLLPDMDGFELVQQLRSRPGMEAVPILAVSGFLSGLEQARRLHVGFTDYLFKPVEPDHLLATVQAYLRPTPLTAGKPAQARRRLIVDDDPIQLKLLKIQMEQLGFEVTTAADGDEALAKARQSPPDALISDVLMPHLDGFRLCLAVRQDPQLARLPVLLTSAVYTEEADRQLARNVGANAFVLRTGEHEELTEALFACLGQAPSGPPPGPVTLPMEDYTHRVIRQLEHQVGVSAGLARRLALLEAEFGILGRVVETLKTTAGIETVLDELLYRCLDAAGISRGATYLLEPDGRLALRARVGFPDSAGGPLADFFGHADLLRRVLAGDEPVEVRPPNVAADEAEDLLARAGVRSVLLTPLLLGEERQGILAMASANRDLGGDWIAFARAMASQLSQAIELARTLSRLSASEQRFRELVQGLDAIVWEADAQTGRFAFVSQRAEELLGYPVARWLAEPDFLVHRLPLEDRDRAVAARAAAAPGQAAVVDYRAVAAGGQELWLRDRIRVVPEAEGRARQLRGVTVDVTEEKRLAGQEAKLRLAREVQQKFFPDGPPRLEGFDIGGASYPAEATGGDYFDYVPLPDGSLTIAIGDVSGHGFAAALLMAEVRAYLRALALTQTDVGAVVALLNRGLIGDLRDQFVTLLLVQLHPSLRSLRYVSAGHLAGYVLDPSGAVKGVLESTGPPLGIDLEDAFPAGGPMPLDPGDLVLLLTDGIVEAHAPDGTLFGSDRALDAVRRHRGESAIGIVDRLYQAVRDFTGSCPSWTISVPSSSRWSSGLDEAPRWSRQTSRRVHLGVLRAAEFISAVRAAGTNPVAHRRGRVS